MRKRAITFLLKEFNQEIKLILGFLKEDEQNFDLFTRYCELKRITKFLESELGK